MWYGSLVALRILVPVLLTVAVKSHFATGRPQLRVIQGDPADERQISTG